MTIFVAVPGHKWSLCWIARCSHTATGDYTAIREVRYSSPFVYVFVSKVYIVSKCCLFIILDVARNESDSDLNASFI